SLLRDCGNFSVDDPTRDCLHSPHFSHSARFRNRHRRTPCARVATLATRTAEPSHPSWNCAGLDVRSLLASDHHETLMASHPNVTTPALPHDPLSCVEKGIWTPIPTPPPPGALQFSLKDVAPEESHAIKQRGVMTFHLAGCTGDSEHPTPQA